MKAKRILVAFSLLLIVGIGFLLAYFKIPFSPVSRSKAEREIYSALIAENHIFEEHTTLGDIDFSEEIVQYIKDEAPIVQDDTLADFQENNHQSYLLKDYLLTDTSFMLLNDAEVEQFYNDWEAFSRQHPNVQVINSFSRVGFNSIFTQAIVLKSSSAKIFNAPFDYSGDGLVYIFKRIGGRWIEQYEIVLSITG